MRSGKTEDSINLDGLLDLIAWLHNQPQSYEVVKTLDVLNRQLNWLIYRRTINGS